VHTRRFDLALHPAAEPHFVVLEDDSRMVQPLNRAFGREVVDQVIRDPVRDLIGLGPMREEADQRADDRTDGLPAERGCAIDDDDRAAEFGGLESRGDAGDAGAEDADVRVDQSLLASMAPVDMGCTVR
jgi:hypothetical protein